MDNLIPALAELITNAGGKIVLALLIYIIGNIVIKKLMGLVQKSKVVGKLDASVRSFTLNFVKVVLYVILIVSIINVLGVPMASVVTVLASCGVAVGLALQGALSNIAGGLMILIFRPFGVGDYVEAAGAEGTVKEIALLYTVMTTVDNKKITIPNGSLMNANVTNYSSEPTRRIDLVFSYGKSADIDLVLNTMREVMARTDKVLQNPDAPFARLSGGTNEAMEFTARVWVKSADYWDVHARLTEDIAKALGKAGVPAPAVRVINETK